MNEEQFMQLIQQYANRKPQGYRNKVLALGFFWAMPFLAAVLEEAEQGATCHIFRNGLVILLPLSP
ncbi:hypothetical protein C1X05_10170 [Laceyella sacchari]|uniref:Uncharacterized protein n=1 Tax=Laceyella tengchongensis TaxID=574699 RepID=A0AA46AH82_9BACL|nr:hypothetical protein [Laceyella tengchongensis]AUS09161.1 hypothetical protein C1X05_10170 [Laceyella sacchari]SMP36364.1 hypothetical protein SAMN06265361_1202 [Laceyella tengchongensis]